MGKLGENPGVQASLNNILKTVSMVRGACGFSGGFLQSTVYLLADAERCLSGLPKSEPKKEIKMPLHGWKPSPDWAGNYR